MDSRDLETFPGADCPPYAILSHTWGEDEVSFSDIKSLKAETKNTYRKIEYTCCQATKQKLKFCWIDTCCTIRPNICDNAPRKQRHLPPRTTELPLAKLS